MSQRRRPPPDDKRGVADTASSSSLRSGLSEVEVAFELAEERVLDDSLDAASFFLLPFLPEAAKLMPASSELCDAKVSYSGSRILLPSEALLHRSIPCASLSALADVMVVVASATVHPSNWATALAMRGYPFASTSS